MIRILLTGKNGLVGWELQRTLATLGEVIAVDRHGMDLADVDSIRRAVRRYTPNLIVNAAAYTSVDKAESDPDLALAINGTAPGILAEEAKRLGAGLIHYSSDYVFDGKKNGPYTEDDAPNPLNVYGKTKLAGDRAIQAVGVPHFIFRTSWVYGIRGKNFFSTILRLAMERDELRVVNDQIGAPTWSRIVAEGTAQVLAQLYSPFTHRLSAHTSVASPIAQSPSVMNDIGGVYHMTAASFTSWHGFASLIAETLRRQGKTGSFQTATVEPVASEAYPLPALRPKNSRLDTTRFTKQFGLAMPSWDAGARLCIEELLAGGVHFPMNLHA